MAGDIPTGEQSVFHFLDIFALGCGLEACAAAFRRQWVLALIGVVGAVAFHLLGTKWPAIQSLLWPRLRIGIEEIAHDPRRRAMARFIAILLVVGYFAFSTLSYIHKMRITAFSVPTPIKWPQAHPPIQVIYPTIYPTPVKAPTTKRPKTATPSHELTDDELARGAEPVGPPHPNISDPSLDEEHRLNRMSSTQFQDYLAETIHKLREFDEHYHYPEWVAPSEPVPDENGRVPPDQMADYWKRFDEWKQAVFEDRPKKRSRAFKDQFPQIDTLVSYLHDKWPDIQVSDDCFVQDKMMEFAAKGCASYIQAILDKARRQ